MIMRLRIPHGVSGNGFDLHSPSKVNLLSGILKYFSEANLVASFVGESSFDCRGGTADQIQRAFFVATKFAKKFPTEVPHLDVRCWAFRCSMLKVVPLNTHLCSPAFIIHPLSKLHNRKRATARPAVNCPVPFDTSSSPPHTDPLRRYHSPLRREIPSPSNAGSPLSPDPHRRRPRPSLCDRRAAPPVPSTAPK